jgi:isocitrate dehydrogenase
MPKIIYTRTDEAPALATQSLLPIIAAYTSQADIEVELKDISLAGRIISSFPDLMQDDQKIPDDLALLGDLAKTPDANIIKLPNISASIPQLKAAIEELQAKGYPLPDYPEEPENAEQEKIQKAYDRVKGSAVNPVLREGNSDRRAPASVKQYARNHPHSMGVWQSDSKSNVVSMSEGDFYANEKSVTVTEDDDVRIEFVSENGESQVLKASTPLLAGEVIDATFMSRNKLRGFLEQAIKDSSEEGVLFSLHLKATMMKVSDPIIFGHGVTVYYKEAFEKHAELFSELGIDENNGVGDAYEKIQALPDEKRAEVEADLNACYTSRPPMGMVNSDKGITNLHVPSDIIIDASMPAAIRTSGQMWGPGGELQDTKFVIPDRSYSGVYHEVVEYCKKHGAFDPKTMGSVPNVGLMAQKAEEYGSHDKTFEVPANGSMRVVNQSDDVLIEHAVEAGDIWRMCQVKDAPVQDWVKLAVNRARASGAPAVFWLDENRSHDRELIKKVNQYLPEHDTDGLVIEIMSPVEATKYSVERISQGLDTISVTGNVLRDYLTDLFPILELGTSAKMLSIVPLMNGGGLFETGAGGSAPKHVQQFEQEGHLRWDSLGEFLALSASLEHLARSTDNDRAMVLSRTLDEATGKFLESNKSPSRKVKELDNRGSHYYLALYWATALAEQSDDQDLQNYFKQVAEQLLADEEKIVTELNEAQGDPVDVGGYYMPNDELVASAMRPSVSLNTIIDSI